jgi:hypothetical protein
MALKAGTSSNDSAFADSLAEAMENALRQEYQAVKGEPLADQGQDDRRMLLVAIAQGIVRYFKDNTDAWQISVETTLTDATHADGTGTVDDITTTGTLYS